MRNEHPALEQMNAEATAVGEIASITGETITIAGTFPAGTAIPLRPGARVYILTEDDVIDHATYRAH